MLQTRINLETETDPKGTIPTPPPCRHTGEVFIGKRVEGRFTVLSFWCPDCGLQFTRACADD